jgi:hypothetical protein
MIQARPAFVVGLLCIAYVMAIGDWQGRGRAQEQLRADIEARYDAFCAQFGRSAAAGDPARCAAALRELRSWEDEQRAFNDANP